MSKRYINVSACGAASFIEAVLDANPRTNPAYVIENALREIARQNGGMFGIAESNTNPSIVIPLDPPLSTTEMTSRLMSGVHAMKNSILV